MLPLFFVVLKWLQFPVIFCTIFVLQCVDMPGATVLSNVGAEYVAIIIIIKVKSIKHNDKLI